MSHTGNTLQASVYLIFLAFIRQEFSDVNLKYGPNVVLSLLHFFGNKIFAPCKVIQGSLGFWIPRCGFWICGFRIPGAGSGIPCQQNGLWTLQQDSAFLELNSGFSNPLFSPLSLSHPPPPPRLLPSPNYSSLINDRLY